MGDARQWHDRRQWRCAHQLAAVPRPEQKWPDHDRAGLAADAAGTHRCDGPADLHRDEYRGAGVLRSEEHTSELQSLMRISYAVFCLKKKNKNKNKNIQYNK